MQKHELQRCPTCWVLLASAAGMTVVGVYAIIWALS